MPPECFQNIFCVASVAIVHISEVSSLIAVTPEVNIFYPSRKMKRWKDRIAQSYPDLFKNMLPQSWDHSYGDEEKKDQTREGKGHISLMSMSRGKWDSSGTIHKGDPECYVVWPVSSH